MKNTDEEFLRKCKTTASRLKLVRLQEKNNIAQKLPPRGVLQNNCSQYF